MRLQEKKINHQWVFFITIIYANCNFLHYSTYLFSALNVRIVSKNIRHFSRCVDMRLSVNSQTKKVISICVDINSNVLGTIILSHCICLLEYPISVSVVSVTLNGKNGVKCSLILNYLN